MPWAPPSSASTAAWTGSGCAALRACRTVATWSMLTPRRAMPQGVYAPSRDSRCRPNSDRSAYSGANGAGGAADRRLQAAVLRGFEAQLEAVAVGDSLRDVEAEAEAAGLALAGLVAAQAALEQALALIGRHTGAVVHDAQPEAGRGGLLEQHGHVTATAVVAHGVVDEVVHRLLQQRDVGRHDDLPLRHTVLDRDAGRAGDGPVPLNDSFHERAEVDRMELHERLARFELRGGAEVVQERSDVLRFLHGAHEAVVLAFLASPGAQRREVALQHREGQHEVVGGVGQERAQRTVALLQGLELLAQLRSGVVESAGQLRDLVPA